MMSLMPQVVHALTLPEMTLVNFISMIASLFIVFGGIIPFVPQYREIKLSGNAEGFSTFVCLTLLIANTLRIFFWLGHPFELPLLFQSVVMIGTMLAMVQVCTRVKSKSEIITAKPHTFLDSQNSKSGEGRSAAEPYSPAQGYCAVQHRSRFSDLDRKYFWRWTDFGSYIQFLMVFSTGVGAITYSLLSFPVYVETLGFLAVLFEALLGAPQFYRNYQNSSTEGMSIYMVLMWMTGDIFKTIYFILRHAPPQFWICGTLQVGLDIAILIQVAVYRSSRLHIK